MRLTVTVVSPATGQQAHVVIDADPATVVAQLAAELDGVMCGGARAAGPAAPALFVGWHRVPGDMRLADSPILDGSVVSIADPAGRRRPEPAGVAEIRVASGPGAGTLYRLPFGVADIGGPAPGDARAAEAAGIVIADLMIPPLALRVQVYRQGCQVVPFDGVPVLLDRRPLDAAASWRPGQQISVGDTLLDLAPYEPPDAALHPAEDGGHDRRHGRKSHARQQAEYRDHKARIERDARQAVDADRLRRRHDCPDPATVLSIASGPRRRLWERRRTDPDYLLLRAGTADLPSAVELTDPTADEHRRRRFWLIPAAPLTISLAERAVVGVAGPADVPRAAGRWLVGQLAALHSPQDVQICILTDSSGQAAWTPTSGCCPPSVTRSLPPGRTGCSRCSR